MNDFPVKFLRIDDRLLHGQVIVGWLPVLGVSHLVVANTKVANDILRQEMMRISVPSGVALHVIPPGNPLPASVSFDTLIVVASPRDAWLCVQDGIRPERLNVGGMHSRPGKTELLEALHLDDEDREYFTRLMEAGHVPVFQPTPQNDPVSINDIL
ncbi:MAG: PTS sugar transporter subunit IIB [Candidatus Riflebacteria bacterium]|nr:PTS sugar transporter subunit IIB [Candidatus Riflebacteria bacterium]